MTISQIALVIPTCNRPAQLARALHSVARQTMAPQDVVVVDDGNRQDGRAADVVATAIAAGLRARYVRNPGKRGAAAARNFGARSSKASIVAFLDDDDELMPDFISASSKFRDENSSSALTWTNALVREVDAGGATSDEWNVRFDPKSAPALLECQLLSIGSGFGVAVDSKVFAALGGFDESLKYVEDTEFFLRFLRAGYRAAPLEVTGIRINQHTAGRLTDADNNASRRGECVGTIWQHRHFLRSRPLLRSQLVTRARHLAGDVSGLETYGRPC